MDNRKALSVNLIASFTTLGVNACINLLVMPYIVNRVGSETYGFVSLANNIVNYATVITIALNSVSSRFIALAIHRGHKKLANEYFNSVFWADVIICIIILIAGLLFTAFIDVILNVPVQLVTQVRHLFIWLVLNFIISVIGTIFTIGTYITNKLYMSSIINTISIIAKAGLLLLLFGSLPISIAYVGAASFMYSFMVMVANGVLSRKLTPELRLSIYAFSIPKTKEMLSSGIWSSITTLSSIFSDGLDTVITNLFLNGAALGALSVAYMIPSLAATLVSSICALFNPKLTFFYAEENSNGIIDELKINMKLTGIFASILFCGIVTFGKTFYTLVVPDENITLIYQLTCLSCISMVVTGVTFGLTNVFVLTNKLKVNSLVWLVVSFFDISVVLILLKETSLGVYAVAGISKIAGAIMYLTYVPIYASRCLKVKITTFYPLIFRYIIVLGISLISFIGIYKVISGNYSWAQFLLGTVICTFAGVAINFLLLLNRNERKYLISQMKKIRSRIIWKHC